jgi:hypothetical protein
MLEYNGQIEDNRRNFERILKDSVVTGNKHRAEKLTTWAYQVMYHNAERVNSHEITLDDGWLNHKAYCNECTGFGIKRGEAFEREEYLSLLVNQSLDDEIGLC